MAENQAPDPHCRKVTLHIVTLRRGKNLVNTGESSPSTKRGTYSMPKAGQKAKKTGHYGDAP